MECLRRQGERDKAAKIIAALQAEKESAEAHKERELSAAQEKISQHRQEAEKQECQLRKFQASFTENETPESADVWELLDRNDRCVLETLQNPVCCASGAVFSTATRLWQAETAALAAQHQEALQRLEDKLLQAEELYRQLQAEKAKAEREAERTLQQLAEKHQEQMVGPPTCLPLSP